MKFPSSNRFLIKANSPLLLLPPNHTKPEVTETKIHPSPLGKIETGSGENPSHSSPDAMKFTTYKRGIISLRRLDFFWRTESGVVMVMRTVEEEGIEVSCKKREVQGGLFQRPGQ